MGTWYAIHVKPGCEAQAVQLLSGTAKDAGLEELFCPMSVIGRTEGGHVVEAESPTIPGCVVAVAPSKWQLRRALRGARGMLALYDGDASFSALSEGEAGLLQQFTSPGARTIPMSYGEEAGGRVRIQSGPLAGREHLVRKYNRRRGRAVLETSIAGVPAQAQLGLRVTRAQAEGAAG